MSRGDIFAGLAEMNPSLLQTANLLEARIDLKLAGRRRLVPVVLNPVRDKVCGIHLDPAIEPWLAERGFSHAYHETLFLAERGVEHGYVITQRWEDFRVMGTTSARKGRERDKLDARILAIPAPLACFWLSD